MQNRDEQERGKLFRKTKTNKHTNHFTMTIKMGRERFSVHSDSDGHPGEALITYMEPRKPRSAPARNEEKVHNRQAEEETFRAL